jgi:hypothetical protein
MRDSERRSSYQARHAAALLGHDAEKPLARRGILARRAAQRLDESDQRRQRRAQLMAGIGDEIGAQPLGALHRGQIVQYEHGDGTFGLGLEPGEMGAQMPLDRAGQLELDELLLLAAQHAVGRR